MADIPYSDDGFDQKIHDLFTSSLGAEVLAYFEEQYYNVATYSVGCQWNVKDTLFFEGVRSFVGMIRDRRDAHIESKKAETTSRKANMYI